MEFLPPPDPLDRPRGELHVWSIDLSREEPQHRRAFANAALRQVLAAYLREDPDQVQLVSGEHGKPRLAAAGPELEFNLSHSGGIALLAIGDEQPVGVDIEEVHPDRDPVALAERALGPDEVRAVREADAAERGLVFHRHWARHEARQKCLGVGIFRESMLGTARVAVQDLDVAPGYVAAVAVEAPRLPPLRCWMFDPGALQKDGNRVS